MSFRELLEKVASDPHGATKVIADCYKLLMESGQLELNPPRSLVTFCKEEK
jgi:hypothetical protein